MRALITLIFLIFTVYARVCFITLLIIAEGMLSIEEFAQVLCHDLRLDGMISAKY